MRKISTLTRLGGAVLFLCLTASVMLADQVQMKIVGNPLNLTGWAGENVSPYSAQITKQSSGTIGDVNTQSLNPFINLSVVCLDIAENTSLNAEIIYDRTYNTGGTYDPALPPTWTMQQRYDAAARLAAQLFATPTPTGDLRGELSFAIWYIFNPNAFTLPSVNQAFLASHTANIIQKATDALNSGTSVTYTVYTPPAQGTNLSSQRFLGNVSVPEPPAVALLGLNMSGLLGLVLVLRRRSRRQE